MDQPPRGLRLDGREDVRGPAASVLVPLRQRLCTRTVTRFRRAGPETTGGPPVDSPCLPSTAQSGNPSLVPWPQLGDRFTEVP